MSRTVYLSFFFVLLSLVVFSIPAFGDCRAKSVRQNTSEIELVVPFAVPVGVPVAPFAPYFYSYRLDQTTAVVNRSVIKPSRSMALDDQTGRKTDLPPELEPVPQIAKTSSLVAAHCATCHGGEHPKAGLSLEHFESLSTVDRLKAIKAVITGRMPKAGRLDPGEVQATVEELATDHDTKKEVSAEP